MFLNIKFIQSGTAASTGTYDYCFAAKGQDDGGTRADLQYAVPLVKMFLFVKYYRIYIIYIEINLRWNHYKMSNLKVVLWLRSHLFAARNRPLPPCSARPR